LFNFAVSYRAYIFEEEEESVEKEKGIIFKIDLNYISELKNIL